MLAFAVGLITGGMVTAGLAWVFSGLVGWIPTAVSIHLVVFIAAAVVIRDLGVARIPLPERRWQVPRSILDQVPPRAAVGFGFELGLGFRTYVSASAPYLFLATLLLLGESLGLFLFCGAAFGLGRFVMALGRYFSADGNSWSQLISARAEVTRSSTAMVAALAGIALALA